MMSFFDFDEEPEAFKKVKKVVNKAKKKLSAIKPVKKTAKKVVKAKKPKAYKVAGSFSVDENGNVVKITKAIHDIKKGKKGNEKEMIVTFLVKTK